MKKHRLRCFSTIYFHSGFMFTSVDFNFRIYQMSVRCKIKKCIEDDLDFSIKFENLIKMLYLSGKIAIIWGIPYMNLVDFPNDTVSRRNQIMKHVCDKYGYEYIDINKLQKDVLPQESKVYSWKWSFLIRVFDAISMTLFPKSKDLLAKKKRISSDRWWSTFYLNYSKDISKWDWR